MSIRPSSRWSRLGILRASRPTRRDRTGRTESKPGTDHHFPRHRAFASLSRKWWSVPGLLLQFLVANHQDFELLVPGRRAERYRVAFPRLEQRPGDRRHPRYPAARGIHLVGPDDADGVLPAAGIAVGDGGAEEHAVPVLVSGIDDLGNLEALHKKTDAALDLAQAFFSVEVIGIFRAVAIGRGPGHGLHQLRSLDLDQRLQFRSQARVARGRDVVLRPQGHPGLDLDLLFRRIAFARECLAHRSIAPR